MIRSLNIILIFTSVIMLAGVYTLKFSIEHTASERTALAAAAELLSFLVMGDDSGGHWHDRAP